MKYHTICNTVDRMKTVKIALLNSLLRCPLSSSNIPMFCSDFSHTLVELRCKKRENPNRFITHDASNQFTFLSFIIVKVVMTMVSNITRLYMYIFNGVSMKSELCTNRKNANFCSFVVGEIVCGIAHFFGLFEQI